MTVMVYLDHDSSLVMWTPRNLKLSTRSTTAPLMLTGACSCLAKQSWVNREYRRGLSLVRSFVGIMVLKLELLSMNRILT